MQRTGEGREAETVSARNLSFLGASQEEHVNIHCVYLGRDTHFHFSSARWGGKEGRGCSL